VAQDTLVESELSAGRDLVRALDKASFQVVGALWFHHSDVDRWKLLIVTPRAKGGTRDLYAEAIRLKPTIDLSRVEFVDPDSALIRALKGVVRLEGLGGVRLSQNMLNGVYVDDAYIYRMAA